MNVDARIKKSTESILRAGLALLNENKDAKLTDVASQAGVGRATLYRLFKNKEDLVTAITHHCLDEYDRATASIEREATSAMHAMELLFQYAMPLTQEYKFLSDLEHFIEINPELKQIDAEHKAEMLELIDEIRKEVKPDQKLSSAWLNHYVDGLFYAGWLQQTEEGVSSQQAAELAYFCFEKTVSAKA